MPPEHLAELSLITAVDGEGRLPEAQGHGLRVAQGPGRQGSCSAQRPWRRCQTAGIHRLRLARGHVTLPPYGHGREPFSKVTEPVGVRVGACGQLL